ncbi:MAG TPA: tRNA uridine(34) 5-carboxymethylaminomethyl modification radical SAM/GNAT enzyme Elp3 [Anaerolineae bacterium]|nr:tRNA uridine(34) 5-carboxymethylaminomethyl modification radical SAM/GNAT enzyme Elp3 [Anaerolineae bacterium]
MRTAEWYAKHEWAVTPEEETQLLRLIAAVTALRVVRPNDLARLLRRYPRRDGQFSKDQLVSAYRHFCDTEQLHFDPEVLRRLQMKPTRTVSGVATVTVLTKPFPCPGECIFCPTDVRMPKSYLHDEPGAIRAEYHGFDPYYTTHSRLRALRNIGHATDKIELLILGGTWSYYPEDYQAWFVQRCLDALNGVESASLEEAQQINETAAQRNVGLVIETRPDYIDAAELRRLRRLGVTKVQIGAQSCDDRILELNKRGHTVEQTRQAVKLLRAAGFKIQLHWMPNLLGATPASDRVDYQRLWSDAGLRPDELKIYPNALVREAELVHWYDRGEFTPYMDEELIDLIADCKVTTPEYVRLNRIIRDIPKDHIVAGSTVSNLREVINRTLATQGRVCRCIRCREVRDESARVLDDVAALEYPTLGGREVFLSSNTDTGRLAGFLRLSFPTAEAVSLTEIDELRGAAIIREVHVYGPVMELGRSGRGKQAQHSGLGVRLLREAEDRARAAGYDRLAVISAIGTRQYYLKQGFDRGELYLIKSLAGS